MQIQGWEMQKSTDFFPLSFSGLLCTLHCFPKLHSSLHVVSETLGPRKSMGFHEFQQQHQ